MMLANTDRQCQNDVRLTLIVMRVGAIAMSANTDRQ